ncbi:MAG: hypothetical protein HY897_19185 [Deltaproteobacteria bacterium]|nr:hypothetical protein [Deltaproteobacteria bacterium]
MSINDDLKGLYLQHIVFLVEAMKSLPQEQLDGFSGPLLMKCPWETEYRESRKRLLIVGQQTNGWEPTFRDILALTAREIVENGMEHYEAFRMGRDYINTPIFLCPHFLHSVINGPVKKPSFMWTNVWKIDFGGNSIGQGTQDAVIGSFDVLKDEVRILKPDVVVFFTGHYYDDAIARQFPGVEFQGIEGVGRAGLAKLSHESLPDLTFRTYHPGFLIRGNKRQKQNYFQALLQVLAQDYFE